MITEPSKRVAGVFTAPPAHFPTNLTTGAAVIGNGDLREHGEIGVYEYGIL